MCNASFTGKKSIAHYVLNTIRASLKTRIICLASPLIPLHWRGKGAFLEMPLNIITGLIGYGLFFYAGKRSILIPLFYGYREPFLL